MKSKKLLGALLALLSVSVSYSLEVNRNEIQSVGAADTVVFHNYSGPHSVINSIAEIRQIGASLGKSVKENPEKKGVIGSADRYAVIHAVDSSTNDKFDADIFIIGKNATVDHIKNLRRIISSYLSSAYGYSEKDGDTIAAFVTVYNAVYRGNLDYFSSKYKEVVTQNLSADKAGLATDYQEWPGKSQIVIPLYDLNGGLSTVDTSLISDKKVVDSMKGEDDKGIDDRKGMVDIKEREADNAQEKADSAQAKADEEKAKLAEEQKKSAEAEKTAQEAQSKADSAKADADKAKADAEKAKADAEKAKADAEEAEKKAAEAEKAAKENPQDQKAQEEAAAAKEEASAAQEEASQAQSQSEEAQSQAQTAQEEAQTAQEEAQQAQKAAEEQSQKTQEQAQQSEEAQSTADQAQAAADQKRSEAQSERTEIAKDQQELIAEQSKTGGENATYGLKSMDDAGLMSEIVQFNPEDGTVIKESPVTVIRGRTFYQDGDKFIAVAGTNLGSGAVKLVAIDKSSLEIASESTDKLSELSVLVESEGSYFCTVQDGSDFYIAKFNSSLEKQLQSQVKVKAATPITITAKGIVVTDANGQPILLNAADLSSLSPESSQDTRNIVQKASSQINNVLDAK